MSDSEDKDEIHISESNDEVLINEIKQFHAEDLIKQNKELLKKLELAEAPSLERKKGFKKNGEPRKKAEMTEKRKEAIKKMREGREKWLEQKRHDKAAKKPNKVEKPKKVAVAPPVISSDSDTEEEIVKKPKPKRKKKKKVKKIIYEPPSESSSEEEEVIVVKAPRRKSRKIKKKKVQYQDEDGNLYDDQIEELVENLSPDPQLFSESDVSEKDYGYGGIKFR